MIMKKSWKDRKGVSPVIATILMVAITVVLAAVLYVMVMGFGGEGGNIPTGEFKAAEKTASDEYRIQVLSISEAKDITDMKITVSGESTVVYTLALDAENGIIVKDPSGTTTTDVAFVDLNGDKKVSTGDYFNVKVTPSATDDIACTVALSYAPSSGAGGVICDTTFTVPKSG